VNFATSCRDLNAPTGMVKHLGRASARTLFN
jgi:hypothetical protein